jgi:hypothetical protein
VVDDDESPWYRPFLQGIGALVGVAVLVGGLISLVALGAVTVTGIGKADRAASAKPSLYIPDRTPSPERDGRGLTLADLNGGKDPTESETPSATPTPSESPKEKRKTRSVISLSASPVEVSRMEKIYLSGTYPGGEGASLQVQRFAGGRWADFPASTSVSGGTFSTYVMTGQSGANKFRVMDAGRGRTSNPVTVTVR